MKITMIAAVSKDGYLTDGKDTNPSHWTSKEDQEHLESQTPQYDLHIMGSKTYDLFKPNPLAGTRRIILTRSPEKYSSLAVEGQLEFVSCDIKAFVEKYKDKHDACLVLGGGSIYRQFIDAGVLDEILLTIEPVTFGSGVSFLKDGETLEDLDFPAPEIKSLNDSGTKLLRYTFK